MWAYSSATLGQITWLFYPAHLRSAVLYQLHREIMNKIGEISDGNVSRFLLRGDSWNSLEKSFLNFSRHKLTGKDTFCINSVRVEEVNWVQRGLGSLTTISISCPVSTCKGWVPLAMCTPKRITIWYSLRGFPVTMPCTCTANMCTNWNQINFNIRARHHCIQLISTPLLPSYLALGVNIRIF